jgi:hypothetical protein
MEFFEANQYENFTEKEGLIKRPLQNPIHSL